MGKNNGGQGKGKPKTKDRAFGRALIKLLLLSISHISFLHRMTTKFARCGFGLIDVK
jgi:hypothetical protein